MIVIIEDREEEEWKAEYGDEARKNENTLNRQKYGSEEHGMVN